MRNDDPRQEDSVDQFMLDTPQLSGVGDVLLLAAAVATAFAFGAVALLRDRWHNGFSRGSAAVVHAPAAKRRARVA
jgi:hypothetical protein